MVEISYNDVFDAVTRALHEAFPNSHVYGELVKQGLSAGDFNVLPITPAHIQALGTRAKRDLTLDVIYYPTDAGGRAECLQIAQIVPYALASITTANGVKLRCGGFDTNITDDVLHCIVNYPHFVLAPKDAPEMRTLEIKEVAE